MIGGQGIPKHFFTPLHDAANQNDLEFIRKGNAKQTAAQITSTFSCSSTKNYPSIRFL